MNINVFSFFDDEGKAPLPLIINRKTTSVWSIYSIESSITRQ